MSRTVEIFDSAHRVTTLHFSGEHLQEAGALVGREVDTALGYLSAWNLSFPQCDIYPDGKTDFVAVYRDDKGERQYVIGAIWHGEKYGFHS